MVNEHKEQMEKKISGISLASFLQMLEQERKSCTLVVSCEGEEGRFFFHQGDIIDADYDGKVGLDAAYTLLSWEDPQFVIAEEEDRIQRIKHSLAHILIHGATKRDEGVSGVVSPAESGAGEATAQGNPLLVRLTEQLIAIPGVNHYYLLNRQGKMITQSSKNQKIGDFIAYTIVSGIQMREVLEAKGLHRIKITLSGGEVLLIIPGGGIIIGLLLDESASETEVHNRIRRAVAKKKKK